MVTRTAAGANTFRFNLGTRQNYETPWERISRMTNDVLRSQPNLDANAVRRENAAVVMRQLQTMKVDPSRWDVNLDGITPQASKNAPPPSWGNRAGPWTGNFSAAPAHLGGTATSASRATAGGQGLGMKDPRDLVSGNNIRSGISPAGGGGSATGRRELDMQDPEMALRWAARHAGIDPDNLGWHGRRAMQFLAPQVQSRLAMRNMAPGGGMESMEDVFRSMGQGFGGAGGQRGTDFFQGIQDFARYVTQGDKWQNMLGTLQSDEQAELMRSAMPALFANGNAAENQGLLARFDELANDERDLASETGTERPFNAYMRQNGGNLSPLLRRIFGL